MHFHNTHNCFVFSFSLFIDGQSEVEVRLVVRKYVDKGSSVTLHCEHNVPSKILYKVSDCVAECIVIIYEINMMCSSELNSCSVPHTHTCCHLYN